MKVWCPGPEKHRCSLPPVLSEVVPTWWTKRTKGTQPAAPLVPPKSLSVLLCLCSILLFSPFPIASPTDTKRLLWHLVCCLLDSPEAAAHRIAHEFAPTEWGHTPSQLKFSNRFSLAAEDSVAGHSLLYGGLTGRGGGRAGPPGLGLCSLVLSQLCTFGETKAVLIYATVVVSSHGESYQPHGVSSEGDER